MSSYVELLKACKEGNHKKVKKLLGVCKDICDVRDLTDKTLLHYCFKYEQCADLILEVSPELLDVGEKLGYTVLHLASMIKPPTSLKYLLSKKPDINKRNNELRSSLLLSVIYDNYEALKILCEHNAEVNVSDISGVSPLHYAAKIKTTKPGDDETNIIDLLLQYGANIECLDFYERTALVWAVCSNNIVKMNHLITKGANIYCKDAGGLSILHYATSNGNLEIIKILLENYNFDIESFDNNKCTVLMYACSYNNPSVIEFLLEKGAHVNAEDCKRRNGAHFASGKGDLKNLEILHKFKCDLWKLNYDSNYPLHEAAYKGHAEVLQFLIDNLEKKDQRKNFINHKNSNGQTALHLATVKDNLKICSILLTNGADPNIQLRVSNGKSMTALDLANKEATKSLIIEHNGQTSDNLLKASVISEEATASTTEDLSETDDDETINSRSCNNLDSIPDENVSGNEKETKSLSKDEEVKENEATEIEAEETETKEIEIKEIESKEVETKEVETKEIRSEEMESREIESKEIETEEVNDDDEEEFENKINILEISEEYRKVLFTSCYNGSVEEVESFIKRGGSLTELVDSSGKTLLHYSLKNKNSFKLIIETVPKLINQPDYSNITILHMVIMSKQIDQLQLLLEHGADFNFPDSNGRTALHLAVIYDNLEALQIMNDHVKAKSEFQQNPDSVGNYPLHYAVEICKLKKTVCRCKEYIELLLNMDGDIECRDNVNRTPLLLAINIKNNEAVLILLKYNANIMAKDNQNLCSIHYVCSGGSLDIFNQLAELEMFNSNIEDPNGLTPIFYAISSCNEKVVKRLIELNAKIDIVDQHGRSVCHKAAEIGAFKCLELLISYNVNPWLKSEDGTMPLHEAAYRGYKEIAEILLNTDSAVEFINDKNISGQTALHLAAVRNDCPMCFLLISKGSNVNELLHNTDESDDLTAYDLATTPYCKETLYTFGGRSAKRIIDYTSVENESEVDQNLEELAIIRIDNSMFIPRTSVRSTELALSTMPSDVNTFRNTEVSNGYKSSVVQPLSSPKKIETPVKKNQSVISSENSFLNGLVSGVFEDTEIPTNDEILSPTERADNDSECKIKSEKCSMKNLSQNSQCSEFSELLKFQKSDRSSRNHSVVKRSTRTKSGHSYGNNRPVNVIDKVIKDRVQNSVINYEYARLNSQIAINLAREKIRRENIEKLKTPKIPHSIKSSKSRKPKLSSA